VSSAKLSHHDLCFGCGTANLFGLQMELERQPDGAVSGRFFVKQDHQGPPGNAHGGVIAAALDEAMSLAIHAEGTYALTGRLEVDLRAPAPVGRFVQIEASVTERQQDRILVEAVARGSNGENLRLAQARGEFVRVEPEHGGLAERK
jgi:acyl-coenzyme A thioesterase PaaI-like protein